MLLGTLVPLELWMAGERSWDAGLDCEEARGGWAAAGLWTLSLWESLSDVGLVFTPSEWPWAADWDGLLRFRVGLTRYCRGMGPVCTEVNTSLGLWIGLHQYVGKFTDRTFCV